MSRVRTGEIKALSGLRIVAAVWVVLFHFRPLLASGVAGLQVSALAPVINGGAQGVDLFFILSGFVLTWNYLDRMGESWSTRATLHFLWLRLARVWPVYLVTHHLAAAFAIFTLYVGRFPLAPPVDRIDQRVSWMQAGAAGAAVVPAVLRRVELGRSRMVDQRGVAGVPAVRRSGAGHLPDRAATRARGPDLAGGRRVAMAPMLLLLTHRPFYTPWSWLPRIVMQFTAGALACAAVRKLDSPTGAR